MVVSKITMDVVIECSQSAHTKLSQYIKCCRRILDLVGSGADLEGVSGWGSEPPPPPPGIFKIYISENNISRFSALTGVFFFVCRISKFSGSLRLPVYYIYLIRMKVCLCPVTILRQLCLLSWNLKVVFASSYTICICAHIPVHSHLVVKVSKYRCMYNVYKISKTVIFLHFFKK